MPELQSRRRRFRLLAGPLLVALMGGCHYPLAVQDPYFAPGTGSTAALGAEASHVMRYNEALRAVRQSCVSRKPGIGEGDGPDPGARAGRAALADLCAALPPRSVAAHGETMNAYRRWVEDRVRELPEPDATAARAGE